MVSIFRFRYSFHVGKQPSNYIYIFLQLSDAAAPMSSQGSTSEEFRKQTDYISIVFIHTESARAGALLVSLQHLRTKIVLVSSTVKMDGEPSISENIGVYLPITLEKKKRAIKRRKHN